MLGVPVGTLIASAGIFSVALGLGAQGFVSDIVTGFFILLEDQIDVGDYVKIETIEGDRLRNRFTDNSSYESRWHVELYSQSQDFNH